MAWSNGHAVVYWPKITWNRPTVTDISKCKHQQKTKNKKKLVVIHGATSLSFRWHTFFFFSLVTKTSISGVVSVLKSHHVHCKSYYWTTLCPNILQLAKDLLHPTPEEEKRRHKKKRLVQCPNSYFMDVKCPGLFVYISHSSVTGQHLKKKKKFNTRLYIPLTKCVNKSDIWP